MVIRIFDLVEDLDWAFGRVASSKIGQEVEDLRVHVLRLVETVEKRMKHESHGQFWFAGLWRDPVVGQGGRLPDVEELIVNARIGLQVHERRLELCWLCR